VGGLNFTVLPEETGLLVPPHDVNAFAASIDRILSDELWAQKLRKRATERVQQNFSWSSVAVQLSDLYRRLLAQSLSGEFLMPTPRYGLPVTPISSSQKLPVKVRTKVS
jgi:D-inositol-3-phosphate glycosyltransferase